MRVLLLGPPGAGKGTQADRIAARFQLVHLATGDLLRANVADGTPLGEVAQAYLDSGELVPDEVVVAMMLERLTRPDYETLLRPYSAASRSNGCSRCWLPVRW